MRKRDINKSGKNHNIRYLPLVYFLPQELIAKCPTLASVPRNLSELSSSESILELIGTESFEREIMDATAALAFPHFGFSGWKEDYTGDFPVWKLSYAMPLWLKGVEQVCGWGWNAMLHIPLNTEVPFFSTEYITFVYKRVVQHTIIEQGWQPLLNLVREMPCHEDFEQRNTHAHIDFMRKWYHTRAKKVRIFSLEAALEDGDAGLYSALDTAQDVEEIVITQDYIQRFLKRLSDRDRIILQLRIDGYTHTQIAERLGYANHSAIIKRMQKIQRMFKSYQQE